MLYSLKKLTKKLKKSEATIRIALDRYDIERIVIEKKHFYEISDEQFKILEYFLKTRRDLREDKEKQRIYSEKLKRIYKKWNEMLN